MAELYWNNTDRGKVVDPLEVVGALTVEFSVLTQVIVCATALKSSTNTSENCLLTALAVAKVMVKVAAELFVTVFTTDVMGTVAALLEAAMALLV